MASQNERLTPWVMVPVVVLLGGVALVVFWSHSQSRVTVPFDAGVASAIVDSGAVTVSTPVPVEAPAPRDPNALPDCGNGVVDQGELCDPNVQWNEACPAGFGLCWVCTFDCHHKQLRAGLVLNPAQGTWDIEPFCSETEPQGKTVRQEWGPKGLLISRGYPGYSFHLTYDSTGHLATFETRAARSPALTTYTYGPKGNVITSSELAFDDAGVATEIKRVEWDSQGRPVHELTPGKSEARYEYDDFKHVERGRTDKNGDGVFDVEYRTTFDDAGTRMHYWLDETGDGVPEQDFAYGHNDAGAFEDVNGNGTRDVGEADATEPPADSDTETVIDDAGLVQSERIEGVPPECTRYSYTGDGQLQRIETQFDCNDPNGDKRTLVFEYDERGLLMSKTEDERQTVRDTACLARFADDAPWAEFKEARVSDADRKSGKIGTPEIPH